MTRVLVQRGLVVLVLGACWAGQGSAFGATPRSFRSVHAVSDPAETASPFDLVRAAFGQEGQDMRLRLTTAGRWSLRGLQQQPESLCVDLYQPSARARTRLCLRVTAKRRLALRAIGLTSAGQERSTRPVAADVTRTDGRTVFASFAPGDVNIALGGYRWQATAQLAADACPAPPPPPAPGPGSPDAPEQQTPPPTTPEPCRDVAPARPRAARLFAVRAIGCSVPHPGFVLHGSRRHHAVALTFDDGPSSYTAGFLRVLERERVPAATFFEVGQQVGWFAARDRRMLRDGFVLGDHSWNHADLAGGGYGASAQMRSTNRALRRYTGFTPCLFRPPYGASSGALVADARAQDMATINWDVDPRDWSLPGSGAIYQRIVSSARNGSIVLMHDGGGPRSETLAALPEVISTLRHRGYDFVSVLDLLGGRMIYGR